MSIFEYPYVIITILVMIVLLMGLIGLYFTMKSAKTAKGTPEKSFCGTSKMENTFDKARMQRENRCMVYISVPLEGVRRLCSEARRAALYGQIKMILLQQFLEQAGGEISLYGDEDFVALNQLGEEEILQCIDNCYKQINELFAKLNVVGIAHVYFGYYLTSSTEVSFQTVLGRVKQACSMAEDQKVLHCRWDNLHGKEFERKITIENNIEDEIDNNRFFLEYQPIVDAKTNKIIGAEVLSRLNSHTEGVLSPQSFLAAVNNVGLNRKFDYYIFEKNCKWIANDRENRMKYVFTINFSRHTLSDPTLADRIIQTIEKYGIDYSCIAVEILEDGGLDGEEKQAMVKNLSMLKSKGILILLDDFGKGYTTFGDLTEFDISIVKIDKSITQSADNQTGFVVLRNIIKTADDLGMKTLCEGIESQEHKRISAAAGCDMFQGYYLYRPMPVAQLEALLEKQES